jgi:hypothetical protein
MKPNALNYLRNRYRNSFDTKKVMTRCGIMTFLLGYRCKLSCFYQYTE